MTDAPRFLTPVVLFLLSAIFYGVYRVSKPSADGDISQWVRLMSFLAAIIFLSAAIVYAVYWLAWAWQDVRGKANEAASKTAWVRQVEALAHLAQATRDMPHSTRTLLFERVWNVGDEEYNAEELIPGVTRGFARQWIQGHVSKIDAGPLRLTPIRESGEDRGRVTALYRWLAEAGGIEYGGPGEAPKIVDIGEIERLLS